MPTQKAYVTWEGKLKNGQGTIVLGTDGRELAYAFGSRFEEAGEAPGSSPEELRAGALAGCFSMALAHGLAEAGYTPRRIETVGRVQLSKTNGGFEIPQARLEAEADVPVIESDEFQQLAQEAKENCPVSKLFANAKITLDATLLATQRR